MKKQFGLLLFLLITAFCFAQKGGKTVVFKVRAKLSQCSISCEKPFFLLEINNPVVIKVKGKNKKVVVAVTGGQVMLIDGETYYVRFTRPGPGLITVYQYTPEGRKVLAAKMQEVKAPPVYFCGIKMDSVSKGIKMKGTNFYAWSDHYKKEMPVVSFDMVFIADTTAKKNREPKKTEPIIMKSDSCMLTKDMRTRIMGFQPRYNYIYLNNILLGVPDGSKRLLEPIELKIIVDTADKEKLSLTYGVRKKKL